MTHKARIDQLTLRRQALTLKWQPFAIRKAGEWFRNTRGRADSCLVTYDDCLSAALHGLCLGAARWDATRSSFGTCVGWSIFAELRQLHGRKKPPPGGAAIPFLTYHASLAEADLEPTYDDGDGNSDALDCREEVAGLLVRLTRRERVVIRWHYTEGCTLKVIGKRLGITRERVRQIREGALEKMRYVEAAEKEPEQMELWDYEEVRVS